MEVISWTTSHTRPALQRTLQRCRSARSSACLGCAAQPAEQPQRLTSAAGTEALAEGGLHAAPPRAPRRRSSRRQAQGSWFAVTRPPPRPSSRRAERRGKSARQKKMLELVMEQSKREHMLSRLPCETYQSDVHQDLVECELCLEEYREGEELMRLPCLHVFHGACVRPWLQAKASTCPLCQTDLCEAVDM